MSSSDIVNLIYNAITLFALGFCVYFLYTDVFKSRNSKK